MTLAPAAFKAYDVRGLVPQQLDEDEVLTVTRVPLRQALARIRTGEMQDAKSIAGLYQAAAVLGVSREDIAATLVEIGRRGGTVYDAETDATVTANPEAVAALDFIARGVSFAACLKSLERKAFQSA